MKSNLLAATILIAAMTASAGAYDEQASTDMIDCRAEPKSASEVLTRLAGGSVLTVRISEKGWSLIEAADTFCWINFQFMSPPPAAEAATPETDGARNAKPLVAVPSYRPTQPQTMIRQSPRRSTATPVSPRRATGGACPCSGRNVCIGPRGGRYCITSGGKKRYGV